MSSCKFSFAYSKYTINASMLEWSAFFLVSLLVFTIKEICRCSVHSVHWIVVKTLIDNKYWSSDRILYAVAAYCGRLVANESGSLRWGRESTSGYYREPSQQHKFRFIRNETWKSRTTTYSRRRIYQRSHVRVRVALSFQSKYDLKRADWIGIPPSIQCKYPIKSKKIFRSTCSSGCNKHEADP